MPTHSECIKNAEEDKKKKYHHACNERRAAFTPIVTSIDGVFGTEANFFIKRLAERLAEKWEKPYSRVMAWTRTRLSFAVLRATGLCLRGSRKKWRSLGIQDGSPIALKL